ncbi:MAG: hypothetical protein CO184_01645 [Candidatus Zambryskibacteria bacterium CG_4_9_14_3_um_filter_40_16]|uniref:Uncharacterized protein n=1 Tax=Candidatus Zambryskibacteria bacterium CG_4_9_14_3_um_filter_40_16 TaxID=1975111 RepID=A0A2M7WUE3_9BACT|nr:MAG: hypothetical protein CO184_01645 [Candidatus Zambryskibacteria bacterium CG_4_9_14_3_um_filter_40_16]
MGKPSSHYAENAGLDACKCTQGSKTFQYLEEKKTTPLSGGEYFLSSGERKGKSPNPALLSMRDYYGNRELRVELGVVRQ